MHSQVIVGDAIAYMKDYIKEGRLFDYVFADLTDVPISPSPRGELWDFMRTIMGLGTRLIRTDNGKYMTHVRRQNYLCICLLYILVLLHSFSFTALSFYFYSFIYFILLPGHWGPVWVCTEDVWGADESAGPSCHFHPHQWLCAKLHGEMVLLSAISQVFLSHINTHTHRLIVTDIFHFNIHLLDKAFRHVVMVFMGTFISDRFARLLPHSQKKRPHENLDNFPFSFVKYFKC